MKKKICPCCDQPITGIYCKGCRRFVFKAEEQKMGYYLNERHPESERNCTYHSELPSGRSYEEKKEEIRQRLAARQQEKQQKGIENREKPVLLNRTGHVDNRYHPQEAAEKRSRENRQKKKSSGALIWTITALLVCFMLIFSGLFVGLVNHRVTSQIREVAVPEPLTAEEVDVLDDWERTDEEVKEAGIPCNSYGHFPLFYEDAEPLFMACVGEAGFGEVREDQYSYNQVMDEYTWFSTWHEFALYRNEGYCGIIEIDADTATGEIHSVGMYSLYADEFYQMADAVMSFMEEAGIADGLPDGQAFYEEAIEGNEQREDGFKMQYGLEVSCYMPNDDEVQDFFKMTIYAPGYYTFVE